MSARIPALVEITEDPGRFTITARRSAVDNFYVATFRRCGCERPPCTAAYDHGKTVKSAAPGCDGSNKAFCHALHGGYHREHVDHLAAQVAKTYERKWRPRPTTLPGITAYMRQAKRLLVECPSWPVVEAKPLPPPCDCESCRATLALVSGAR